MSRWLNASSFWRPDFVEKSAWLEHGPFAFWLMSALRPRTFVELGTHRGFSYFVFCQAAEALKLATQGYAVDSWQGDEHAGFYDNDVFERVSAYNQSRYAAFSTLIRDTFDNSVDQFSDYSIDLLHIDGRHFYEDVKHDFENWRSKLSSRSLVLFHDTAVQDRDFGVHRLWRELIALYPHFEFQHGHGLGVLGYGVDLPEVIGDFFAAAGDEAERSSIRQAYSRLGSTVAAEYKLWLRSDPESEIQKLRVKSLDLAMSLERREEKAARLQAELFAARLATLNRVNRGTALEADLRKWKAAASDLTIAVGERDAKLDHAAKELGKESEKASQLASRLEQLASRLEEETTRVRSLRGRLKTRRPMARGLLARLAGPVRHTRAPDQGKSRKRGRPAGGDPAKAPGRQSTRTAKRGRKPPVAPSGPPQADELARLNARIVDWSALQEAAPTRRPGFTSIVVLALDNVDLTRDCIDSIVQNTDLERCEIILVDNGSDDQSNAAFLEMAQDNDKVRLLANSENYMFSVGNNIGSSLTSGQYLVFLNNDTRVAEGWLTPLIAALEKDPRVGIVGPKLLYPDDTLQCGGLVFSDRSKIPYHLYRGLERGDPAINKPRTFQALTGACFAVRAADFMALKGFDPLYLNGCEDLDLCFRMKHELGKDCFYQPVSEIYHLESKTPNRSRHINLNRTLFVDRWRDQVRADDAVYLDQDGFDIVSYEKPGSEPDGETASYVPTLQRRPKDTTAGEGPGTPAGPTQRLLNVGFSSIWYARGISFHTLQLALALEGKRFCTHIFARWESKKFQNSGPIHHPRAQNFGDDPSPKEIVDWAVERKLDLMIFMEVHRKDWKRVNALKAAGIRVMCYENLDLLRWEFFDRYSVFDYFLFCAFHARDLVLSRFPKAASLTLPWGVALPVGARPGSGRNRPMRFVHVAGWGGLDNRKNTPLLIRAFDQAASENAVLHVFTQTPLATYGAECVEIVARNKSMVVREGTVDNVFEAYGGMDMLLWPSKREGLGLPIVEALASGLPVLTTDGYLMKQWIVPGDHGVLCPATPRPGDRVLPEMEVDEGELARLISWLASAPAEVSRMAECVARDREAWSWSWQPKVFREQIGRIIEYEGYTPPGDLSYLPEATLAFEKRRASHEAEARQAVPR